MHVYGCLDTAGSLYKRHFVSYKDELPSLVKVYPKPALWSDSDIVGSEEAGDASKVFLKKVIDLAYKNGLIAALCRSDLILCRHSLCR